MKNLLSLALLTSLSMFGCDDELVPDPEGAERDRPAQEAETAETAESAEPAAEAAEPAAANEATLTATVGEAAPGFTLRDQAGAEHSLAQYRGKIVVLEWINPDCPYVQRHYRARTMRALVDEFPSDQVVWLAVDSSHFVTPESSQAWREEHELPYPILQDPAGEIGRRFGATTTPNMYVVDAAGVLRYQGAIDDDPRGRSESPSNYVQAAVRSLLAGEDVATAQTRPYGCSVKYENS